MTQAKQFNHAQITGHHIHSLCRVVGFLCMNKAQAYGRMVFNQ